MITKTNKIKCDVCGRFVNYEALANGYASHRLLTPDAEGTEETYESFCERCLQIELDKADQKYQAMIAD